MFLGVSGKGLEGVVLHLGVIVGLRSRVFRGWRVKDGVVGGSWCGMLLHLFELPPNVVCVVVSVHQIYWN